MNVEICNKDASARTGYIHLNEGKIKIPALLSVSDKKFLKAHMENGREYQIELPEVVFSSPDGYFPVPLSHAPTDEKWKIVGRWLVILNWTKLGNLRELSFDFCIFPGGCELFQYPRKFVDAIICIRKAIGAGKPLYVPGIALPSRISLLSCLTIDLFDDALAIFLGEKKELTMAEGIFKYGKNCVRENILFLQKEFEVLETFLNAGRVRELVEMRIRAEPELVAMLRYMDFEHFEFMEGLWPSFGKKFYANSKESLWRIDIQRYRRKVSTTKPLDLPVLLLLPCAAKKPYHLSHSHMLVEDVLKKSGRRNSIHVLSLTSPIGVVPEELENFFPANAYDIPVTGHWDYEEKKIVLEGLKPFLGKYREVVAHLPPDYHFVVEHFGLKNTCVDEDITSAQSLKKLEEYLVSLNPEKVSYSQRLQLDVENALRFQFGEKVIGILENAYIKGNRWNWKIFSQNCEFFEMSEAMGRILIKREGTNYLANMKTMCVYIENFQLHGDVFIPGVISATPEIRCGDEVAVVQNERGIATGSAMVSATELSELKRGIAVKVREKF
ncbi:MAG: DUF5591 domain-containing protein [Thermoplasmata archaeon]